MLARRTSVPTPAIDQLYPYLDPETPSMPEGTSEIPLKWGTLVAASIALLILVVLTRRLFKKRK
jgi:hypothetical protein